MAVIDVVVERQPVFDVELEVVGYELLLGRSSAQRTRQGQAGVETTTASLLFDAVTIGVSRLVGDRLVFCDADRPVLAGEVPVVLPPELTVLEVSPSLATDAQVVEGCRRLADGGFTIALDGVEDLASCASLLGPARIAKVAHASLDLDRLSGLVAEVKSYGMLALALGVATSSQFDRCRDLGFDYFQGDLLSAPQVVPGRTLDASSISRLRQAALLVSRQCSATELEEVVRSEPAMAYQLLQIAGVGADNGFRRPVRSIREALVLLGWRHLQSWITFLLETRHGSTTDGEAITTLTRARMCELLAQRACPEQSDIAFAAGMLSAFDLLLDMPLDDVLAALPLDEVLCDAVARRDTPVGRIVADVVDCQLGRAASATRAGFSEETLSAMAISALRWAIETSSRTGSPESG